MAKFTVDLTDETPDTLESGQNAGPGWYKCVLDDVYDDQKSGATVFQWLVQVGPFKGRIFDRVNDPDLSDNENGAEMGRRRIRLLGSRLGLIGPDACGKSADLDFQDAIGKEAVVHVEHRRYEEKDKMTGKGTGNWKEIDSVKFDGVYPLDHHKIPEAARKALGLPPAKAPPAKEGGGNGGGGKKSPPSPEAAAAVQPTPPLAAKIDDMLAGL